MAFERKKKDRQQIRPVGRHIKQKHRLKALRFGSPVKNASLSRLASQDSGFMWPESLFGVDHSP